MYLTYIYLTLVNILLLSFLIILLMACTAVMRVSKNSLKHEIVLHLNK